MRLDQGVQAQWGQVENVYQRRADLVPSLVETVKGAAAFEKETFTAVAEARARLWKVSAAGVEKVAGHRVAHHPRGDRAADPGRRPRRGDRGGRRRLDRRRRGKVAAALRRLR